MQGLCTAQPARGGTRGSHRRLSTSCRSVSHRGGAVGPAPSSAWKFSLLCVLVSTCYCQPFTFSHPTSCAVLLSWGVGCVSRGGGAGTKLTVVPQALVSSAASSVGVCSAVCPFLVGCLSFLNDCRGSSCILRLRPMLVPCTAHVPSQSGLFMCSGLCLDEQKSLTLCRSN